MKNWQLNPMHWSRQMRSILIAQSAGQQCSSFQTTACSGQSLVPHPLSVQEKQVPSCPQDSLTMDEALVMRTETSASVSGGLFMHSVDHFSILAHLWHLNLLLQLLQPHLLCLSSTINLCSIWFSSSSQLSPPFSSSQSPSVFID